MKKTGSKLVLPVPMEMVKRRIYVIRGVKAMLDSDLAELYQVPTFRLNEQVKRNLDRFPSDFLFQLSLDEFENLRSQFAISNLRFQIGALKSHGGRRYLPYVFTEQGVAMLSSVLNSRRAIAVNIAIMRAFVKLREIMSTNKELAKAIEKLEAEQKNQKTDIKIIFQVIKKLISHPPKPKEPKGFRT